MKLYRIQMNDYFVDQYDGFVVAAESAEAAVVFLKSRFPDHEHWPYVAWSGGYEIDCIGITHVHVTYDGLGGVVGDEPEIILSSYRGG